MQGISSAAITAFVKAAQKSIQSLHSFMLLRHGTVVAEGWWYPYRPEAPHMLFSLSKSFTSTAVGFAVAEGRLSVDDSVLSFFPDDAPKKVSPNLAAMQVRHLLSMSTGHDQDATERTLRRKDRNAAKAFLSLPVEHEPGTHFVYNSAASYMLSAIVQKLTGQTLLDYLTPRLFEPLGIQGATWESYGNHEGVAVNFGGWGLNVKTEDIARLGQLYLQKGHVEWQTPAARSLGKASHLQAGLQRPQPEPRLGTGLRLPVLALPARGSLPRRRRFRAVLHRHARAGRGAGDHGGRGRYAGRADPGMG